MDDIYIVTLVKIGRNWNRRANKLRLEFSRISLISQTTTRITYVIATITLKQREIDKKIVG